MRRCFLLQLDAGEAVRGWGNGLVSSAVQAKCGIFATQLSLYDLQKDGVEGAAAAALEWAPEVAWCAMKKERKRTHATF